MSQKRAVSTLLAMIVLATVLVGCSPTTQEATFIGYKERPADSNTPGVAIVQLASGVPAEAECKYSTLENGAPVQVVKRGDNYEVIAVSPDWTP